MEGERGEREGKEDGGPREGERVVRKGSRRRPDKRGLMFSSELPAQCDACPVGYGHTKT